MVLNKITLNFKNNTLIQFIYIVKLYSINIIQLIMTENDLNILIDIIINQNAFNKILFFTNSKNNFGIS